MDLGKSWNHFEAEKDQAHPVAVHSPTVVLVAVDPAAVHSSVVVSAAVDHVSVAS